MNQEEYQQMTIEEINEELNAGGKFVIFYWTISYLIQTQRRASKIYFLKHDEFALKHGLKYLLPSLILGWWGFPWGPIYTIQSIFIAFFGKDVTNEVIDSYNKSLE